MNENKYFIIRRGELEKRLDPGFYKSSFRNFESILQLKKRRPLYSVAIFSDEVWNQIDFFDSTFPYIEIGEIDLTTGEILKISEISKMEAPSRARMIVRKNDILISTTRPNRGAISYFNNKMQKAIASTGFSIIRETKADISKLALFYFLRCSFSLLQMERRATGGNYPAITQHQLSKILIPNIDKNKQEIVITLFQNAILNKQQKEQQAKELLNSIDDYLLNELGIQLPTPPSNTIENRMFKASWQKVAGKRFDSYYHKPYFESFFAALKKGKYPICNLHSLSTKITSGATPKAGGEDYTNSAEGIPFIRSGELNQFNKINFSSTLYIKKEIHERMLFSSQLKKNDILIAIVGATIGSVAVYEDEREANINQAIALVRPKQNVVPEYVKSILLSAIGKILLDHTKRPVARANINLDEIGDLVIPFPATEKQNEIVEKVWSLRQQSLQITNEAQQQFNETKKK